ncbi:DEAD/DEAH box helicase [Facklamia hominis]|uniref:DEAD/DEAH box helicase n=1 Tax=Facklamia hominis TaxID=178214 RepID=UPI0038FD361C
MKIDRTIANQRLRQLEALVEGDKKYTLNSLKTSIHDLLRKYNQIFLAPLSITARDKLANMQVDPPQGNEECWPMVDGEAVSSQYQSLVKRLDSVLRYQEQHQVLLADQKNFLNQMKIALEFVSENDRNKWLSLFMTKSVKHQLAAYKAWIEGHQVEWESLLTQANSLIDSDLDSKDYQEILKNSAPAIHLAMLELSDYRSTARDQILLQIQSYLEKIDGLMQQFDQQWIEGRIQQMIQKVKLKKGRQKALDQPITLFRVYSSLKIPEEACHSLKIESLGDLKTKADRLARYLAWTQDECQSLKQEIDQYLDQMVATYYPKLSLSEMSEEEKQLVMSLYRYLKLKKSNPVDLTTSKRLCRSCKEILDKLWQQAYNTYQASQLPIEEQKQLGQKYQQLFKQVDLLIGMSLEESLKIEPADAWQAMVDFEKSSSSYYAVIDRLNGGGDQDYRDLPSIIVDRVKQFSLETDGFGAILRPYQEFGVKYALTFKKILLGDEMGLGKTIQALAIANHLNLQGLTHHVVLAPLSILANWQREIAKWTGMASFLYRGNNRKAAVQAWQDQGGVLLLNYEQSKHLNNESMDYKPDLVIVDEAHYVKNPNAQRSKNAYQLARSADYNLFMTGTPLENRLSEMKQLLSILQPNLSFTEGSFKNDWLDEAPQEFKQKVATVYLRRKRLDVLKELPEIEMVERWSNFSKEEQAFYDEAVRMGISGMMRMRRAGFSGVDRRHSEKIDSTCTICEEALENGDKIIIFSFFKMVLEKLEDHLGDKVVGMISGDITASQRQDLIDRLEAADKGAILLSQIDAGGVGLNIQAANIVILCEPQWKPSTEQQAIGRVYRMGQAKNVVVYRLLTQESIDETLMDLLARKTQVFEDYAQDSVVSEAFDHQNQSVLSETELQKKVFEIERERLARKTG